MPRKANNNRDNIMAWLKRNHPLSYAEIADMFRVSKQAVIYAVRRAEANGKLSTALILQKK